MMPFDIMVFSIHPSNIYRYRICQRWVTRRENTEKHLWRGDRSAWQIYSPLDVKGAAFIDRLVQIYGDQARRAHAEVHQGREEAVAGRYDGDLQIS